MVQLAVVTAVGVAGAASAASLGAAIPSPVERTLQVTEVARAPIPRRRNFAAPVAIAGELFVVDQSSAILRRTPTGFDTLLDVADPSTIPDGVRPSGWAGIQNVSAGRTDAELFVTFASWSLPEGDYTRHPLPGGEDADLYLDPSRPPDLELHQIVYRFAVEDGALTDPSPIVAFRMNPRDGTHRGGGMLTLPDGRIALARGDNLTQGFDGRAAPQDDAETVGKIVLIDPDTGEVEVAAKGVRNVQRLQFVDPDRRERIAFADIGHAVSEEIDTLLVADLADTAEVENFGWGRAPDGLAREGRFYIAPEHGYTATGEIEAPEDGFLGPWAEWGRWPGVDFAAVSGPVTSSVTFDDGLVLFGDIFSGRLLGAVGPWDAIGVRVFEIGLVDASGAPTTMRALTGFRRVNLRLFRFPDGAAGLMSESTGALYAIAPVSAAIPAPPALALLLVAVAGLMRVRPRRGGAAVAPAVLPRPLLRPPSGCP